MTLSDTHLVLLSAAAQRDDRLLLRPGRVFGKALEKLAARLASAGLAEQIRVSPNQPHWSKDEAGEALGLRIAAAGLAAIGVADESAAPRVWGEQTPDIVAATGEVAGAGEQEVAPALPRPPHPRPSSKRALVINMLRQESGASVEALMTATGWLFHTVRAVLTSLRHKGYTLSKARDGAGVTTYYLTEPASETAAASDADQAA